MITKATAVMQPMKGCRELDVDVEVLKTGGGLSPKLVGNPPKAGGLLEFKTVGGELVLGGVPDGDGGVGVPETGDGGVGGGVDENGDGVVGGGVAETGDDVVGGDKEEEDVGKMQDPTLGFTLVVAAVPPKSQLVCTGFF